MKNKVFNIPLTCSFVDVIARKFLNEYKEKSLELAEVLFLLPNRRACKSLKEAFLREQGLAPLMLPKILPIGDVEEDELFITGFNTVDILDNLSPAVSKTERLLRFTKLIMAKPLEYGIERLSSEQACYLANELTGLIDLASNEGLSFDNLANLVPEEYSQHWQETLKLLEIITKYWPAQLEELKLKDPTERKNQLLKVQAEVWKNNPPKNRVVIAGTTATFPSMKELVKVVLGFEKSELILSGVDKSLDDEDWKIIDETHPQFELKDLLEYLEVNRFEVGDYVSSENKARDVLISEVMRPAKTTNKWRDIAAKNISREALQKDEFNIINCSDIRIEAISIALIMREVLETPEKTAALITNDRNLARRVSAELGRWNLKVDDSAGVPLHLTPIGQFLRSITKVIESGFSDVEFLGMLKHPFFANGMDYGSAKKIARNYEKLVLRKRQEYPEGTPFVSEVKSRLSSLVDMQAGEVSFKELIKQHIMAAEELATTDVKSGKDILWAGDAGEAAADFIADLYDQADSFGKISLRDYAGLLDAMMTSVTVRPKFGTHPRLKILGPIEARLSHFDVMIVGEVNEGSWPKTITADPWMSRPMKKEFGFPLPEKATGVMAHDFSSLISGKEVYITRAERVQGTPMVKSRWLMRLETVIKALGYEVSDFEDVKYQAWAKYLDRVEVFKKILPPAPKPPVSARPREIPATAMEDWIKDPYIIFAKYILKLRKLDELNKEPNVMDFGNMVHGILEVFNKKYDKSYPQNAKDELLAMGKEYLKTNDIATEIRAFWWPSFVKMIEWLTGLEEQYRNDVAQVFSEIKGAYTIDAPAGKFKVTAKSDRVDITKDGKINIIDYKTGSTPSQKEVKQGFAPQLPIAGLIALKGGFEGVSASEVNSLMYWKLKGEEVSISGDIAEILEKNYQNIEELVQAFDFEETAYICRPRPKYIPKNTDYVHLARIKEWSVTEEGSDE